ncbi:MAG TPA: hypothetical protein PK572_10595 [Kiritimatiellia bacterium]|nr:hypothetical protein [Kiritimatiellia bacterium]
MKYYENNQTHNLLVAGSSPAGPTPPPAEDRQRKKRKQNRGQLTQAAQEIHKDASERRRKILAKARRAQRGEENKTEQESRKIRKTGKESNWLNSRRNEDSQRKRRKRYITTQAKGEERFSPRRKERKGKSCDACYGLLFFSCIPAQDLRVLCWGGEVFHTVEKSVAERQIFSTLWKNKFHTVEKRG